MREDLVVRQLFKEDDSVYEEFLTALSLHSPSVLAYHYPFYREIIASCNIGEAFYAGLFSSNQLIAVLPGFIKQTPLGTAYNSMPFFGPNAGVLCKETASAFVYHEMLLQFVTDTVKSRYNPLTMVIYTPFLGSYEHIYRSLFPDAICVEKHTQYLNIPDIEWDSKIKYDIRKAERAGITVSEDIENRKIDRLYEIYQKNCEDYGIPLKPKSFIEQLAANVKENGNTEFYFAHHENEVIGALIVLYSGKTLSYYLPCSTDNSRTLQPTTYLIAYAFQKAKDRGITYWNWEASPDKESGVYKFKHKWGSLESSYKVFINVFCEPDSLKKMGIKTISEAFPYFYIYPFNKL
jgi:hypothetical protein